MLIPVFSLLFSVQLLAQLTPSKEAFSNKIEFSTTNFSATLSGAKTNYSALTTYHGSIYFVYCDENRRPIIGKISPSGAVSTQFLDKNDQDIYQALDDGHHVFSIGVDRDGYLHVTGDNHGNKFGRNPELTVERYRGAPYMHWVSSIPENIDDFEFIGLNQSRLIPGYAFTYFSFHNDMNGLLYTQYRSRIHQVNLPPGSNGWCMARYDEQTRSWKVLGNVPNATNATAIYPALVWEQAGHYNPSDPTVSFYQGYMSDVNFDFNNRMHIGVTINADETHLSDTHILYACSDDGGDTFKTAEGETISTLPMGALPGARQASIVDQVSNPAFDGIYRNASVVFDMDGTPAVSFLTQADRSTLLSTDRDHHRYWMEDEKKWSELIVSPNQAQTGSQHFLDCNGVITFIGARIWNAQMYRVYAFGENGYNAFALPDASATVNVSGVDERGIREENVARHMIHQNNELKIVTSTFKPAALERLADNWEKSEVGMAEGSVGMYNKVIQIESSGEGLAMDGSLDVQYVNKMLNGNGGVEARIINVDYNEGAFAGLMISDDANGTGNYYAAIIDYEGLKAWSNTGSGGNIHFVDTEVNEPSEWLKVTRIGETLRAYHSNNGEDWLAFDSLKVDIKSSMTVGLISGSGGDIKGTTRADHLKTFKINPSFLPVELISFSAVQEDQQVKLTWETASEVAAQKYTLERSYDGKDAFREVANMPAENALDGASYVYFDTPQITKRKQILYYRLRTTDLDGTTSLSSTMAVSYRKEDIELLQMIPNPINTERITIKGVDIDTKIELFSLDGRLIRQLSPISEGQYLLPELVAGIYIIRTGVGSGEVKFTRFVVEN